MKKIATSAGILQTNNLRRTVFIIAWPAVLRMLFNVVVQMIDLIMVGRLGAVALAAVGIGNQVFFFSVSVVQAFSIGTTALVAQYVGIGDEEAAKKVARQSLLAVMVVTFILSIAAVILSRRLIEGMVYFMPEKDLEMIELGASYLSIVSISISLRFSLLVVNAIFQGAGDTRTPLYLMVLANAVNVVGNYMLIFGHGPFPALGVQGAAIATCAAGMLAGGLGIGLLFSKFSPLPLNCPLPELFDLKREVLSGVLFVGIPSAVEQIGVHLGQIFYTMIVASLGSMAVATQQILHNAYILTYLPGMGFAMTATTLVGQFLGAEKRERALKSGMETTRLALTIMSAAGLIFFFFPDAVVGLFSLEEVVRELAVHPLMVLALAQPALACIVSLMGGLRGAGDTRWVMYVTLLHMLVLRMAITLILVWLGMGLVGVWLAMLVESYSRAIFFTYRFRRKIPHIKLLIKSNS